MAFVLGCPRVSLDICYADPRSLDMATFERGRFSAKRKRDAVFHLLHVQLARIDHSSKEDRSLIFR